ncbi:MFS transporter [Parvularcula marina]|uniref:MFS transporter n=1 Tax=Parvularcula marina TaxID=2292771 RepID=A0A371RHT5_9PROT|nr:MFS transporter [Parvularcula marina]RFB05016.1 MFS transporter [Parvularcula marina]
MSSLFLERRFWALCGAQNLGAFADNALRQATILAIFGAAAAGYGTADFSMPWGWGNYAGSIVSMGFTISILIFSPLSGQIADLVDRDILVRKLKFIELALMSYAALCFAIGNGPQLLFALFLMGTQSAFFSPVRTSLMPQYYRKEELTLANGVFNAVLFVAIVSGLGIGGALIQLEGGRIMISGLLVVVAALGALFATQCPPAKVDGKERLDLNLPVVGVRLFDLARLQSGVLYPMLGIGWFWMMNAASLAILPNVVRDNLEAGLGTINLCLAISALGAGLGSLVAGIIFGRFRDSLNFAGWAAGANAIAWLIAWAVLGDYRIPESGFASFANAPLILILLAAAMTNGMFVVPLMAALQSRAPNDVRAKIMGASNMTNGGLATLAALAIIPFLGTGLSPHHVFLIFAVMQAGLLFFMWKRKAAIREAARGEDEGLPNPLTEDIITPAFSESSK